MYVILVYDIAMDGNGARVSRNVFKICKKSTIFTVICNFLDVQTRAGKMVLLYFDSCIANVNIFYNSLKIYYCQYDRH